MSERNTYEQAGDWMIGAVKRNPEALLVLAAGCALLMRSKAGRQDSRGQDSRRGESDYYRDAERSQGLYGDNPSTGAMARAAQSAQGYASEATSRVNNTVGDYASAVRDRATDAVSTVSDYASDIRDSVASGASRLPDQARSTMQRGFARILQEQPLAVAAMGLAAGATLAAVFPATETENQMLGPAHDAMVGTASRVAESLKSAASETGDHLKEAARERGLDPQGLKGLAREVAGKFADNVTGRSGDQDQNGDSKSNAAPGLVPEHTGAGNRS